jgi:hypothetical protein
MVTASLPGAFSVLTLDIFRLISKKLDIKTTCHLSCVNKYFAGMKLLESYVADRHWKHLENKSNQTLIKVFQLELKVKLLADDVLNAVDFKTPLGRTLGFPSHQEAVCKVQSEFQECICEDHLKQLFSEAIKAYDFSTFALIEVSNDLQKEYKEAFSYFVSKSAFLEQLPNLRKVSNAFLGELVNYAKNSEFECSQIAFWFDELSKEHGIAILELLYSKRFEQIEIRTKMFSKEVNDAMTGSLLHQFPHLQVVDKVFQVKKPRGNTTILTLVNPFNSGFDS